MKLFGGYLSDYEVTHKGDGNNSIFTRDIDDRKLVIHPISASKVESYYVGLDVRPYDILHGKRVDSSDFSSYGSLGEALEDQGQ